MIVRTIACTAGTLALAATAAPAASADSPHPWVPYQGGDSVVPAGEVCSFELHLNVLEDKERYRVVETYADGSTRREEWTGQLILEFVNADTGQSVVRNTTGRGDFVYGQDGSWSLVDIGGHIVVGIHTDDAGEPGMYYLSGSGWEVSAGPDGVRTLTEGDGTIENICDTLS